MAEELGSTNISDLLNETESDINDNVVNKILNELDGPPEGNSHMEMDNMPSSMNNMEMDHMASSMNNMNMNNMNMNNMNMNNMNNMNMDNMNNMNMDNMNMNRMDMDMDMHNRKYNDFRDIESDNTVKKINNIIIDDTLGQLNSVTDIINEVKYPILVFCLVILLNNSIVTDILYNVINNLIKNKCISDNVSLFIRALVTGIIMFLIKFII